MSKFRLIAARADGTGETYHWGDTYEVEADSYAEAREDVLGREGTKGSQPYTQIKKAWAKTRDHQLTTYAEVDPETGEPLT